MDWESLCKLAQQKAENLDIEYRKRLKAELKEIQKQGANRVWVEYYENENRWDKNPNGLVFPWLLGLTTVDPIESGIGHQWDYIPDFPDIDIDFLPMARQTIKSYAYDRYKHVCSVGNWNTYKPKSALQDVARALGANFRDVLAITKKLPDEFDGLTLEDHEKFHEDLKSPDKEVRQDAHMEISRYQPFYDYRDANPEIVDIAYRIVGKIKSQGTHAGGVIIADRPVNDLVPLSRMKAGDGTYNWTSQWTEGDKPQLSKFGLVKYDILGLKTMQYIWQAAALINKSHGISMSSVRHRYIDWMDMDPTADPPRIGYERKPDGTKKVILLNDPEALHICNELKTDSVFQIETDIQKGIISDGKVKSFWDLVVYNALGRPGPMDMIPEYIKRRDDPNEKWREGVHPKITEILGSTYNVIVYQEELTAMWMKIANFTVPEAEAARKVIAKKWADKLPGVEKQWKQGAAKVIGQQQADEWWKQMYTFGRYAFNMAHSIAYSLITYMCLYLKAHYPTEWWAAVLPLCHPDKLSGYMSAARLEGVKFGLLDINELSDIHTVKDGQIIPGLRTIKNIGNKSSKKFSEIKGPFSDIDDMVNKCGKDKTVFERMIKLGAFDKIHPNRRGLWKWYQYKYCSGKKITELKQYIRSKFEWPEDKLKQERERQAKHFKNLYPRRKIPKKILNFKPKIKPTRDEVMGLFDDFDQSEKLSNEKELLGFYWTSPLSIYQHEGNDIEKSKKTGVMEVVVEQLIKKVSKRGNEYYHLRVTDGIQTVPITVWVNVVESSDRRCFTEGIGVKLYVDYNEERKSFKISDYTHISMLLMHGERQVDEDQDPEHEEEPIW